MKVDEGMPPSMSHFPAGFEAIVVGSYSDQYGRMGGERSDTQFTLCQLKDGKPVNQISWYYEDQLTLLSDDRMAGEAILQDYKDRR